MAIIPSTKSIYLLILIGLLTACAAPVPEPAPEPEPESKPIKIPAPGQPWLLVDTRADTLAVMIGDNPMEIFANIAIGTGGAGIKQRRGDEITPLGVFRIGWVNPYSRFKLFFGLDYPNLEYAGRAYREGRIDRLTYERIRAALEVGHTPPQDTPLGGQIGIHGIGAGDPAIHSRFNWTAGCVALNNWQIERLAQWIQVGTRVEIR